MDYEDTHVTPAQLPGVDFRSFDLAEMKDATARPSRCLFDARNLSGRGDDRTSKLRRLVVHVIDMDVPGLKNLLLRTMGVEIEDLPC